MPEYVVGWVGVGAMGNPMCRRLTDQGHVVQTYVRSGDVPKGARAVDSPKAASHGADFVVTILGGPEDVEQTYYGDIGILAGSPEGAVLIDMTTSSPSLARQLYKDGRDRGVGILDAPVSGGPAGAESGSLSIMVGGDEQVFERARPLLELLGTEIIHHGRAGNGQSAKAVNQVLLAGSMLGIVEAFGLALRTDLDLDKVMRTVGHGVAGSQLLDFLWARLQSGDMAPGFKVKHLIKDLRIATDEAKNLGSIVPGTALLSELYGMLGSREGGAERGTQALVEVLYGEDYLRG